MSCLQTAFESYHFFESKLNWEKIFPKDDLSSTKFMLPLRLITQKPPKYFNEKKEVPENIPQNLPKFFPILLLFPKCSGKTMQCFSIIKKMLTSIPR